MQQKQVKDAVNICVESLDSQAPETKEIIKREVMYITRTDDITGVWNFPKLSGEKIQLSNVFLFPVAKNTMELLKGTFRAFHYLISQIWNGCFCLFSLLNNLWMLPWKCGEVHSLPVGFYSSMTSVFARHDSPFELRCEHTSIPYKVQQESRTNGFIEFTDLPTVTQGDSCSWCLDASGECISQQCRDNWLCCKEIRWFLTASLNEWIEQPQPGKTTSGTLHDILYPSRASYQWQDMWQEETMLRIAALVVRKGFWSV